MLNTTSYRLTFTIPEELRVEGLSSDRDLVTIHASTESPEAQCRDPAKNCQAYSWNNVGRKPHNTSC